MRLKKSKFQKSEIEWKEENAHLGGQSQDLLD